MDQIGADQLPQNSRQVVLNVLLEREALDTLPRPQMPLPHIIMNVKLKGTLAKVGLDRLARRLKAHRRVQVAGQIAEGHAQVEAVLCVEAGVVEEVEAAADDVAGGEGGPVVLACVRIKVTLLIINYNKNK